MLWKIVFIYAVLPLLIIVVSLIASGTYLYHKTEHKNLGITFREIGYIFSFPLIITSAIAGFLWIMYFAITTGRI